MKMEYMSCPEAAKKWGISKIGYMWLIPKAADKPVDKRQKQKKGGEKL
jgi:hypothetical protein